MFIFLDFRVITNLNPQKKPFNNLKGFYFLGGRPGSNRRPLVPQTNALTN